MSKTNLKPIIGIPAKKPENRKNDFWQRMELVDDIRFLICKYGGIGIMLLPSEVSMEFNTDDYGDKKVLSEEEIIDLRKQVDLCDGIILQGGLFSCQFEVEIAKYALEKDIPLLGICAGFNNILRALGSNVYEDIESGHDQYDDKYRHNIDIVDNTLLHLIMQNDNYMVNSFHTMVASKNNVEDYALINAYSDDGLVEGFELPLKRFVLALKWHPELMKDENYVERLFKAFLQACIIE